MTVTSEPGDGRWAGWGLLAVTMSLLIVHGGAAIVAGQRASGISDIGLIEAYYSNRGLLPMYWQHGLGILFFGVFLVGIRRHLAARITRPGDRRLLDVGTLIAAMVIPLALTELALQASLVQLVPTESPQATLAIFVAWDWLYNGLFYWLEVIWVGSISLLLLRTGIVRQWISILGLVSAGLHVFHSAVLMLGLPDQVTLPGTGLFAIWFVALGVSLVRADR